MHCTCVVIDDKMSADAACFLIPVKMTFNIDKHAMFPLECRYAPVFLSAVSWLSRNQTSHQRRQ